MRTNLERLAGLAIAIVVVVVVVLVRSGDGAGASPRVPAALADRGVVFRAVQGAAVTEAQAVSTARQEAGVADDVVARALLAYATDPMLADAEAAINDRKVWVVAFEGLSQYVPGPATANGESAPGHWIHSGYSYIDADTGAYLATVWTQ